MRLLATAFMLLVVASGVCAQDKKPSEPVHEGKPLTHWLTQLAADRDVDKATEAIERILKQSQESIPRLLAVFIGNETRNRDVLTDLIVRCGPGAIPPLTQALWNDELLIRVASLLTLRKMGYEARSAVPSILVLAKDESPKVRELALDCLRTIGLRSALPAVLKHLDDSEPTVRLQAADTAIALGGEAKVVLAVLLKLLPEEASSSDRALRILSYLGPEAASAVPDVLKRFDKGGLTTSEALRTLSLIGPSAKEAVHAIKTRINIGKGSDDDAPILELAEALWSIDRDPEAVKLLKNHLASQSSNRVAAVALMLWRINQAPEAVRALRKRLKDLPPESSPETLLDALAEIGPAAKEAVPELIPLLAAKSDMTAFSATRTLARIGPDAKAALDALTKLAQDDVKPYGKAGAIGALVSIRPDQASFDFAKAILQKGTVPQKTIVLRRIEVAGPKAKSLSPTLSEMLMDPSEEVRMIAADVLGKLDRRAESLAALIKLLNVEDAQVRSEVVQEIGFVHQATATSAVPALTKTLWDRERYVRQCAGEALSRIGPTALPALPALLALLGGDEYEGLQSAACEAIGLIGPTAKEAIPALKQAQQHPDLHVRVHAALALWHVAGERADEAFLTTCLASRNYRVRIVAAELLWRLKQDTKALAWLVRVVSDVNPRHNADEPNEQYMAIRALGRIGSAAKEAIPALRSKLTSSDLAMQVTATATLEAISKPPQK